MPAITLSPAFFRNELRAYSNWRTAFWRELFQNSVDARASTIWIDFEEVDQPPTDESRENSQNPKPDKDVKIRFEDDGPGMDRQTLEETYFVVGETTKSTGAGADMIGGFGRARIITCFAHKRFEIHTQNWLCQGSGTHYTIQEAPEPQEGCNITVTISPDLATMDTMERALRSYLRTCQLDTIIYIRGVRFKEWTHKNRLAGQLPFGKIYLNKSKCSDGVLVRVNGVQMFTRYSSSTWQIVLEIDPKQSREILTSNRDGLTAEAAADLDRFIGKIWVNPVSATRTHQEKTTQIFGNTVYRVKGIPKHTREILPPEKQGEPTEISPFSGRTRGSDHEQHSSQRDSAGHGNGNVYTRNLTPDPGNGDQPSHANDQISAVSLTPCYVHVVDCATADLARAAKSFLPDQISGIRLKLLQKWTEACAIAATELAQLQETTFNFRTGFVFNEDDHGRCTDGPIYSLLLKPVTNEGRLNYKLTSRADWGIILAIAAHECVHMIEDYHDERYAAKLTQLLGRILGRSHKMVF
jgi:Histidine kinase-, DNA gyrase B-, and HSP90-like ATPase